MLEKLNKEKYIYAFGLLCLLFYFVPFFFNSTAMVHIHDNLDDALPKYKLVADYFRLNIDNLALNGNLPIWAIPVFSQPLSLIFFIDNYELAYLLNDFVVRIFAFVGVLLLGKYFKTDVFITVLISLIFTYSISYTMFGLSIAGLPLVFWAILNIDIINNKEKILTFLAVLFIAWNTWIMLSGIFFILLLPFLFLIFKIKSTKLILVILFLYGLGLLFGNWNIIYAEKFSGIIWHRVEFSRFNNGSFTLFSLVKTIIKNVFFYKPSSWYHMYYVPLGFILITGFIIGILSEKRKQIIGLISLILFCTFLYNFYYSTEFFNFTQKIGGTLVGLNLSRFFFIVSFIVVLIILISGTTKNKISKFLIVFVSIVQILIILINTPHWNSAIKVLSNKSISGSYAKISNYYEKDWFDLVKKNIDGKTVISVGIDPMKAVVNEIPSLDGYYQLYPLQYKNEFRNIIKKSMVEAERADYYNNWGSRVYTFHKSDLPESIDFCYAKKLGADFVIASKKIDLKYLTEVLKDDSKSRILYKIECQQ